MKGRESFSSDAAVTNEDVVSFLSPGVQLSLFLFLDGDSQKGHRVFYVTDKEDYANAREIGGE